MSSIATDAPGVSALARRLFRRSPFSQYELAEALGVSQPNVSRALSDKTGRYTSLAARICTHLGHPVTGPVWLVDVEPVEPAESD
jgi:transcriptional regulator with XRE-family HTH domain